MTHDGQLVISVTDEATKERWEECVQIAADELGKDPEDVARWEVLRELTEAYSGGDPLGEWCES